MYSEMHIWCYNIKKYYIKHSQNWDVYSFQIDGQAFISSETLGNTHLKDLIASTC